MLTLIFLCAASLLAGLTDSIVGGGGLVQLPALFIALPNTFQASVLGTNKMSSVFGTSAASITYARKVKIEWPFTLTTAGFALASSLFGAWLVSRVHPSAFKPVMLVVLIAMALFTFFHKDFGALSHDRIAGLQRIVRGIVIGILVGFYDGFFGPGTGSILIFLFIGMIGMDFLGASAAAKIVNVATNVGALAYFGGTLHILYKYALPMAAFNILGGVVGAHLAIARGNKFVRVFFQFVIAAIIARYAWSIARP